MLGLRKGRWRCAGVLRGHAARIICVAVGGCRGRLIVTAGLANIRHIQVMEKDPGPKRWERRPVVISHKGTWHAHVFQL